MGYINIEIKAICDTPGYIREYLKNNNAQFKGIDLQTDTYFKVQAGRMKLREGNIENALIYYERDNQAGPKRSDFSLVHIPDAAGLKQVLARSLGVKVVVDKKREIWYIGNVKFHIDEVPGLGNFVEIEASNFYADATKEQLQQQCDFYLKELRIKKEDLVSDSYSDMLLEKTT